MMRFKMTALLAVLTAVLSPGGTRYALGDEAKLPKGFYAFGPDHTAGVRVATADFDGDGVQDVAMGTGPGTGSLKIPVATGSPWYSTRRGRPTCKEMSFIDDIKSLSAAPLLVESEQQFRVRQQAVWVGLMPGQVDSTSRCPCASPDSPVGSCSVTRGRSLVCVLE